MPVLRLATFNVANLDDKPNQQPTLAERIAIMRCVPDNASEPNLSTTATETYFR